MAPCYLSSQYFHALLLGICALVSTLSNIIERLQKLSTASNVIKVNDCCGNKLCFILYHKILSVLLHGFYADWMFSRNYPKKKKRERETELSSNLNSVYKGTHYFYSFMSSPHNNFLSNQWRMFHTMSFSDLELTWVVQTW